MADYAILMLLNGYLVSVPVKDLSDIDSIGQELIEIGYKKPRFQETFNPVEGIVVKREKHDKQTKTGKDMWRFYIKEGDGTGAEHMIIAFDPTEFKKGDKVLVSMGQYGKQAKHVTDGEDWEDSDTPVQRSMDDIPF